MVEETENKSVFLTLVELNVNEHVEKKNDLSYLSWSWAIDETLRRYPNMTYKILRFENNLPYVYDSVTGYMVFTEVTIDGLTKEMWLPVMDNNNNAMLDHRYSYQVKKYTWNAQTRRKEWNGEMEEKWVEAATMFDVNKTIMRCLVKNLAVFGLGLYLYSGEDLPKIESDEDKKPDPANDIITEEQLKLLSSLEDKVKNVIYEKENIKNLKELTMFNASKWIKYCQSKNLL